MYFKIAIKGPLNPSEGHILLSLFLSKHMGQSHAHEHQGVSRKSVKKPVWSGSISKDNELMLLKKSYQMVPNHTKYPGCCH